MHHASIPDATQCVAAAVQRAHYGARAARRRLAGHSLERRPLGFVPHTRRCTRQRPQRRACARRAARGRHQRLPALRQSVASRRSLLLRLRARVRHGDLGQRHAFQREEDSAADGAAARRDWLAGEVCCAYLSAACRSARGRVTGRPGTSGSRRSTKRSSNTCRHAAQPRVCGAPRARRFGAAQPRACCFSLPVATARVPRGVPCTPRCAVLVACQPLDSATRLCSGTKRTTTTGSPSPPTRPGLSGRGSAGACRLPC